jgi:hypothetical protein
VRTRPTRSPHPLLDEGDIRHDHVDTRRRFIAEGDAEIDHQPLAGVAVEVEVHADLAGPAESEEQQLVALGRERVRHPARFRR